MNSAIMGGTYLRKKMCTSAPKFMLEDMYRDTGRVMTQCVLMYVDINSAVRGPYHSKKGRIIRISQSKRPLACAVSLAPTSLLLEVPPVPPIVFQ